ncbi:glycosyltransferase family 2 protein [Lyngbya confervoides]|uniref:Glycosyltransferase family 2 protein n=1 Tax=Lyngbya confervoides BDU141951 TaxID=1574623 RepID=A0ABD4SZU9_9CYAN|nr:glycosyltransferase family 2 protein [Lyngbya confervoides]MCM1981597.1 glycosyltransferase family 2 protein [Lyngbya confervoides BDU141951]
MLDAITPVILTYNEAPNLKRTLDQLGWAKQILIIDSFSQDATLEIANRYPQVRLLQRQFDTHARQWNYGLEQVDTEWVLSLDADYVLSEPLIQEMAQLSEKTPLDAFAIPFHYCVFGRPLRGTLLPPRVALFRKAVSTYIDDGHTQLLTVRGTTGALQAHIFHDDRKPLARWVWAQQRYVDLEVEKLQSTSWSDLSWGDRIRQTRVLGPLVILFYCLFLKQALLDGRAGWYYTFQRVFFEIWLSIKLIETDTQGGSLQASPPRLA